MSNFTPISAAIGGGLIGLSAVLLMLLNGRIAGITGVFAGLIDPLSSDRAWRATFVGRAACGAVDGRTLGPRYSRSAAADELCRHCRRRSAGRLWYTAEQRLYVRSRHLRHCAAFATLDRGHRHFHVCCDCRRCDHATRDWRLTPCAHSQVCCAVTSSAGDYSFRE